jgi:hypothetical protein
VLSRGCVRARPILLRASRACAGARDKSSGFSGQYAVVRAREGEFLESQKGFCGAVRAYMRPREVRSRLTAGLLWIRVAIPERILSPAARALPPAQNINGGSM